MKLVGYFIESGTCLLLFYLFYVALLRKENSFAHNRVFLLVTPLLALLIPLITIPFYYYKYDPAPEAYSLLAIPLNLVNAKTLDATWYIWSVVLLSVYGAVALFLLGRLITQLVKLRKLRKSYSGLKKVKRVNVVEGEEGHSTFSFLNTIYLGKSHNLGGAEVDQIIDHEIAHIQQKHSYDIIYFHLLSILLWFNPAIWWYKSAINTTHEYLADHHVIDTSDKNGYVNLLIKQIFHESGFSAASYFGKSQALKRIEMMKLRTYISDKSRFFLLIPLIGILMASFSFEIREMNIETGSAAYPILNDDEIDIIITKSSKLNDFVFIEDEGISAQVGYLSIEVKNITSENKLHKALEVINSLKKQMSYSSDSAYLEVDELPMFKGGQENWTNFILKNLKYPKTNTQGKVYIEFIVNKNGSVSNARVIKGIGGECDREAQRIVSESPNWIPGKFEGKDVKVRMVVPILFKN